MSKYCPAQSNILIGQCMTPKCQFKFNNQRDCEYAIQSPDSNPGRFHLQRLHVINGVALCATCVLEQNPDLRICNSYCGGCKIVDKKDYFVLDSGAAGCRSCMTQHVIESQKYTNIKLKETQRTMEIYQEELTRCQKRLTELQTGD